MLSRLIPEITDLFNAFQKDGIIQKITLKSIQNTQFTIIITPTQIIATYPWAISPETAFKSFSIEIPPELSLLEISLGEKLLFTHNQTNINELAYFITSYIKEILHTPPTLNHITISSRI